MINIQTLGLSTIPRYYIKSVTNNNGEVINQNICTPEDCQESEDN